jgi:hypothetical protein
VTAETGSYRSMDLSELSDIFDKLGPAANAIRAVGTLPEDIGDYVYLAAIGPFEMSTNTELVPMSALPVWDVNGYYRAIGITWPYRPTRGQMREAYRDTGGPYDDYATYAFKRLLDPVFRRKYDRRTLGQPIDDEYRFREAFRLAADMASRQSRLLGKVITYRQILGEDLFEKMSREAEAEKQAEDIEAQRELREEGQDIAERPESEDFIWLWAYFLWQSRHDDDQKLSEWQRMLHQACVREGLSLQVAVGYFGATSGAATARVRHPKPGGGHTEILFLREDVLPSQALADVVVATFHTWPHNIEHDPIYC